MDCRIACGTDRSTPMRLCKILSIAVTVMIASPAAALDLNSFRAQHGKPALSHSVRLSGIAYQQALLMAGRQHIDHANFAARMVDPGTTHAENVRCGCGSEDCAIRQWPPSRAHGAKKL